MLTESTPVVVARTDAESPAMMLVIRRLCCPCFTEPTWRSSSCDCWSSYFEHIGLLFPDRQMEASFLVATKRSKLALAALPLIFIFSLFAGVLALVLLPTTELNQSGEPALIALLLLPATVGLVFTLVPHCCLGSQKYVYPLQGIATMICAVTIFSTGAVIEGMFASLESTQLDFVNVTNFPDAKVDTCAAVRQCGMYLNSGALNVVTIVWVLQKLVVVVNVVSARVMFGVAVFNLVVMLMGCAVVFFRPHFALGAPIQCAPSTMPGTVSMACTLLIDTIAAAGALLWAMARKAAGMRQLYFWTTKLELDIKQLEGEANPFDPDNLQRWLQDAAKRAAAAAAGGGDGDGATTTTPTPPDVSENGMHALKMVAPPSSSTATGDRSATATMESVDFWAIPGEDIELHTKIAAGSSGAVWRAIYRGGPAVAAKQIFSNAAEPMNVTELAHEVAVLGQLAHENIVKFLGLCIQHRHDPSPLGLGGAQVYIVQEFCPKNLRDWMEEIAPNLAVSWKFQEVVRIATEIAEGASFLHSRQIVHRDLKPENVLLAGDDSVRIADFGVSSQSRAVAARRLATEGSLMAAAGTVEYMAPETYVIGLDDFSCVAAEPPADVYSFGIILWELLSIGSATGSGTLLQQLWQCHQETYHATNGGRQSLRAIAASWEWPSLEFSQATLAHFPSHLVSLVSQSWKFYAAERVSFAFIAEHASAGGSAVVKEEVVPTKKPRATSCKLSGIDGNHLSESLVAHDEKKFATEHHLSVGMTQRPATPETFASIIARRSLQCGGCWVDFWSRRSMHFGVTNRAEARFQEYIHSDEFYAVVKWPFEILGALHGIAALLLAGSAAVWGATWAIGTTTLSFVDAVLYCSAGALGWWKRGRTVANEIVGGLVAAKLLVMVIAVVTLPLSEDLTFNDTLAPLFVDDADVLSTSWQACDVLVRGNGTSRMTAMVVAPTNPCWDTVTINQTKDMSCGGDLLLLANSEQLAISWSEVLESNFLYGQFLYDLKYGIAFFHLLTMPVSLMMFALPFRFYTLVLVVPAATTVAVALVRGTELGSTECASETLGGIPMFKFISLLGAAAIVYVSTTIAVMQNEKTQRSLFVLRTSLQSQESALEKDARFRKYRDVLRLNRGQFSLRPVPRGGRRGSEDSRAVEAPFVRQVHRVKAVTVQ